MGNNKKILGPEGGPDGPEGPEQGPPPGPTDVAAVRRKRGQLVHLARPLHA